MLCGWSFPSDTPNLLIDSALFGEEYVYFSKDDVKGLQVDEQSVINISNHNIGGYTNGGRYLIFEPFDLNPYYEEVLQDSENQDYVIQVDYYINEVIENNFPVEEVDNNKYLYVIGCAILFILMICNMPRQKGKIKW